MRTAPHEQVERASMCGITQNAKVVLQLTQFHAASLCALSRESTSSGIHDGGRQWQMQTAVFVTQVVSVPPCHDNERPCCLVCHFYDELELTSDTKRPPPDGFTAAAGCLLMQQLSSSSLTILPRRRGGM